VRNKGTKNYFTRDKLAHQKDLGKISLRSTVRWGVKKGHCLYTKLAPNMVARPDRYSERREVGVYDSPITLEKAPFECKR